MNSKYSANPKYEISIYSLTDFESWVRGFAKDLSGNEIILLKGDLGVGKTEFVKNLAKNFSLDRASSPTFAIHQRYTQNKMHSHDAVVIHHFDLYRLDSLDDLESVGFWDLIQENAILCVEWHDKIPLSYWPKNRKLIFIEISRVDESQKRLISIS